MVICPTRYHRISCALFLWHKRGKCMQNNGLHCSAYCKKIEQISSVESQLRFHISDAEYTTSRNLAFGRSSDFSGRWLDQKNPEKQKFLLTLRCIFWITQNDISQIQLFFILKDSSFMPIAGIFSLSWYKLRMIEWLLPYV